VVPYKDFSRENPFYIPTTNAICQLFGKGEYFHAGTKVQKKAKALKTSGISDDSEIPERCMTDLSPEVMSVLTNKYNSQAIILGYPNTICGSIYLYNRMR
jgi:hypothetical protein